MKKYLPLYLLVAVAASNSGYAATGSDAALTEKLRAAGAQVRVAGDGLAHFIRTPPGREIPLAVAPRDRTPEGIARSALSEYGPLFGITDAAAQLELKRVATHDGRSNTRFQQLHGGIPVIGGELVVNLRGQQVVSINGEAAPKLRIGTTPKLGAGTALDTARAAVAKWYPVAAGELRAATPELSVYVPSLIGPGGGAERLVWRTEITNAARSIRELVLVDAQNGSIPLHFNQVDTVRNRLTYTAGGASNIDTATLPLVCGEDGIGCESDADALAAHTYAGHTYDFYFSHHNRDSIDGAGMPVKSVVHFYADYACPNAFWNGEQMTYCDGLVADDVVAHELTHGVTQHTSNLFYYYQSGAINESLSDVWGEFVDLTNGQGNDAADQRWLMGEDVPVAAFGGPIRSMSHPEAYGDPDRMGSTNYYTDDLDNGGVHSNSGVNNKAVYLMVDGDTFNGRTVTGLGIDKVAAIYYEVQANLLTSGADYADLYQALQQGCANLVGTSGITAVDCDQVKAAADAVEMNQQPVAGYNPEAVAQCPGGEAKTRLFADDMENAASGKWLTSGTPYTWSYVTGYATSGVRLLWGDDANIYADASALLASSVRVPVGSYLHFRHAYDFEFSSTTYYDGALLEYSTDGGATWASAMGLIDDGVTAGGNIATGYGNPLAGRTAFVGASHGYVSSRLNLTSLAGQNVRFRWRIGTDVSGFVWGWFVDDVELYSCTEPPLANAGSDQNVSGGAKVSLSGTSTPGSSAIVSYQWTQLSGTAVTLAGAASAGATFTAPNVNDTLTFRLTVTDANWHTATDDVSVVLTAVADRSGGGGGGGADLALPLGLLAAWGLRRRRRLVIP